MSFTPVAALAALAVLLAACGTQPPVSTLSIRGQLAVPGRVELPPDAQMVVELRDETTDRVLAEQRQPLREISSPQPFDLQLARDKLVPGQQLKPRAPAASDSRLEAVGDSSTYFRADGSRATVSVRGVVFRGCTVQRGAGAG